MSTAATGSVSLLIPPPPIFQEIWAEAFGSVDRRWFSIFPSGVHSPAFSERVRVTVMTGFAPGCGRNVLPSLTKRRIVSVFGA
jgi:hypothetical protein